MHGSVIDGSSDRAPCRASAVAPLSRAMKKSLVALLVVLLVLAAVALERTFTFRSRQPQAAPVAVEPLDTAALAQRSEEHTSELQSQSNLVCRLLLEKKKINH